MHNETHLDGELMAILASDLSDGAKLAAVAERLGAKSASDIAKVVNKPVRTVERHYAELRKVRKSAGTQICGTTQNCVENHANLRTETTQICVDASPAPASITTRATKELPSEVNSYEDNIFPPIAPQTENKPSPKAKRGSRLADDWELPEDWRQWALVNCPAASLEMVNREALKFANHWQSKPGASACKLDWRKTFQNWCLTAFARGPLRPSQGYQPAATWAPPKSAAERKIERHRGLMRTIDRLAETATQ